MAHQANSTNISSTVSYVLQKFITSVRADQELSQDAVDRLEHLLNQGLVPTVTQIATAVFGSTAGDEYDSH